MRTVLFVIALFLAPLFWLGFNVLGCRVTIKELYLDCIEHRESGKPWGVFDEQD